LPTIPASIENGNGRHDDAAADPIRPFRFHGVELHDHGGQAVGDCPFCRRDGKFSVESQTGLWRCWVCGLSGNPLTFLRQLWEASDAATNGHGEELAKERGYLDRATLTAWGVCRSVIDGSWMVPGYSAVDTAESKAGRLDQLYKRVQQMSGGLWKWTLMPTPGLWPKGEAHRLHMPALDFDPARPRVEVCEGPWDGMALWEVARHTKRTADGYEYTGNPAASIIADTNVVAVPGCNVWRTEWTELCRGKDVTLYYDNDHPRTMPGGKQSVAGADGVRRVHGIIAQVAARVRWLQWGGGGYDLSLPSGHDVRDHLRGK